MKASLVWKEGMTFGGTVDGHSVQIDAKAPIGKNSGPTPKELLALGLGGCTSMDVVALLRKYKQPPRSLEVEVEIQTSTGAHPIVFEGASLSFKVEGEVEPERLREAVHLSQSKFCGVSAMLSKAFPIEYQIVLNGEVIGKGSALFE